ncbi:hypothetical protein BC332_30037 [Capsicum chinense]|nr:hypothetical protein BC332_30037 [Capsicum chinense]
MSEIRSLFKELDESKKSDIRLDDNKKFQVEGRDLCLEGPSTTSSIAPVASPILEEPLAEPTPLRRSTMDSKPNPRYADSTSCTFALFVSDPIFFKDAEEEDKWCKAMEEELLAI